MSFRYKHGDRVLDGYTLQRGVGRGAFGEVYYAVSDGGREVALKTILQNPDIELRGIQHCINLKSPHLVSIFDVKKSEEGVPVVIMEYVAGPSLRDLLHEHPNGLGTQRAAYLLREVAKGLAYLHERGIVHRDLKPENLFYEDGYVKIGDYGLSKYVSVSRQSGQTMSVGTVHYMAPEIGSGIYNQSIDIYALGVILHELLTGTVPFTGDSFGEILMKHLTAEPDLSQVDAPFRQVIAKALKKKPEERYQSVEEMARELFEDSQLTQSVHSFNPATLSIQPRRLSEGQAGGVAQAGLAGGVVSEAVADVDPAARTTPIGATPVGDAPPPPPPPPKTQVPSGWPPRGGAENVEAKATPPKKETTPPPLPESEKKKQRVEPVSRETPRTQTLPSEQEAQQWKREKTETDEKLDPLDFPQRLSRVAFTILASAAALTVLRLVPTGTRGLIGALLATATATWAVIYTERKLGPQHEIGEGWPRRMVIAAISFFPLLWASNIGAFGFRADVGFIPSLLCLFLIDWSTRVDPYREERLLWGDAISAALLGFFFGMLFIYGPGVFVLAVTLGTISLGANAFAPWVPHELRKKGPPPSKERKPQNPDAGGAPAAGAAAATSPSPKGTWYEDLDAPDSKHGTHPSAATRTADAAWERAGSVAQAPHVERPDVPPSHFTRVFWLFVGSLFVAAGLSCLVVPITLSIDDPEMRLVLPSVFLGSLGFLGFCLYRGLWARKQGFWSRTLRPFLLACLGNTFLINTYIFIMAPVEAGWRYSSDEMLASLCMAIASPVLMFLIVGFDRITGLDRDAFLHASHLPAPERPVHPFVRFVLLVIAVSAAIAAASLFVVGIFGTGGNEWDRAGFCAIAVGLLFGALFFAHQGLRYRRGRAWESVLRPLIISLSLATIGVCGVFLVLQPQSYPIGYYSNGPGPAVYQEWVRPYPDDALIACVVLTIVASVLGSFAFFVRGPRRDLAASRLCWWKLAPGHDAPLAKRGSGWAGFGVLLWTFAFAAAVTTGAIRSGLMETLGIHHEIGEREYAALEPFLSTGWLALGAAFLASWCVQIGRRDSGMAHWLRGALGQLLVVGAGSAFLHACQLLEVSNVTGRLVFYAAGNTDHVLFLLNTVFAVGVVGVLFLVWPNRRGGASADERNARALIEREPQDDRT